MKLTPSAGQIHIRNFTDRIPAKLAVATTLKSIPPLIIVSIIARASNPYSGKRNNIETMYFFFRKIAGSNTDMVTKEITKIISKRNKFESPILLFIFRFWFILKSFRNL